MSQQSSFHFRTIILCLIVATFARCDPNPPVFPPTYETVQVSICAAESVYCPQGFVNSTISSISYYDYPSLIMGANDVYDLNSPAVYVSDQTIITQYNATHLKTDLYYLLRGSSQVSCFYTLYPAQFLAPDALVGSIYGGVVTWNGVKCDKWVSNSNYMIMFTEVETGTFIGFETLDQSQYGYFMFWRDVPLQSSVWEVPSGVTCTPYTTQEFSKLLKNHPVSNFKAMLIQMLDQSSSQL